MNDVIKKLQEIDKKYLYDLTEFLLESNAIEREYSAIAFHAVYKAWEYLMQQPLDKLDVTKIEIAHCIFMKPLASAIAGEIRNGDVSVGGDFVTPSYQVMEKLKGLMLFTPTTEDEIKEWHIRFENIHPFWDGNGRCGRLIYQWQRVKNGLPIHVIHEGEEQMEYYKWFKK